MTSGSEAKGSGSTVDGTSGRPKMGAAPIVGRSHTNAPTAAGREGDDQRVRVLTLASLFDPSNTGFEPQLRRPLEPAGVTDSIGVATASAGATSRHLAEMRKLVFVPCDEELIAN